VQSPGYLPDVTAVWHWLWRLTGGNPLVTRTVEGGSRRTRHLWVRMGYLGALVLLVVVALLGAGGLRTEPTLGDLAQSGTRVFAIIAYGQVILVCLLAPVFMAGAIATEQSGKTYDILLTTPLSNLQIVLGSLLGRLFFVLALLLSGLPLFAVLRVFGGVPVGNVFVAFAVAAEVALLVGAVAVVLSVLRAGGRKAIFTFVIGTAATLLGGYLLDRALLRPFLSPPGQTTWLTSLHPLLVLETLLNRANYAPPPPERLSTMPAPLAWYMGRPFVVFSVWTLTLSVTMLLASAIWVRRIGQGESAFITAVRRSLRLRPPGAERRRPPRSVSGNPVAWREAKTRGKLAGGIIARWGFVAAGLVIVLIMLGSYHTDAYWSQSSTTTGGISGGGGGGSFRGGSPIEWFRPVLIVVLLVEVTVIAMVALYMSAGAVSREREDGTLDLMLTTPITPKVYIWGKLRGLVRFLSLLIAVPVGTLAIVGLYAIVGSWLDWPQATYRHTWTTAVNWGSSPSATSGQVMYDLIVLPEAWIWLAAMLVPFVSLCVATGMHWSLRSRSAIAAVVPAVAVVGLLALVLGLCGATAGPNVPLLGPILNGFSPATNILMLVDPWHHTASYTDSPTFARTSMGIAAVTTALGYGLIVWSLLAATVSNFDQTVRKLSGAG
jgi:ABC-type transport system involved in multi-copper enzyme maturation permease subunit